MDIATRIEQGLEEAFRVGISASAPLRLRQAMRHAVFPAGGRIRAQLCLRVARACGDPEPRLAEMSAVAVELLHCASLVHDDLPCFDDAPLRRGRSSVQREYGEAMAVLVGDALIVLGFETLARAATRSPEQLPPLILAIGQGVNAGEGCIAGQAMESDPDHDREIYHRAKTAALFEAAVQAGALAAGSDPRPWRGLGRRIGEAYQLADDIADVLADRETMGKPVRRDQALGRPNALLELGREGAVDRLVTLVQRALSDIPGVERQEDLGAWLASSVQRLLPDALRLDVSRRLTGGRARSTGHGDGPEPVTPSSPAGRRCP